MIEDILKHRKQIKQLIKKEHRHTQFISEELSLDLSELRDAIDTHSVFIQVRNISHFIDHIKEIKCDIENKVPKKHIADKYHINEDCINIYLLKFGIISECKDVKNENFEANKDEIIRMLQDKVSKHEICKKFHIHHAALDMIINKYKLEVKSRDDIEYKVLMENKDYIQSEMNAYKTYDQIAKSLDVQYALFINFIHIHNMKPVSILDRLEKHSDEIFNLIDNDIMFRDLVSYINEHICSCSYSVVAKFMKKHHIRTHKKYKRNTSGFEINHIKGSIRIPIEEYLIENSTVDSKYLRERLIAEGLKENKCELCGQSTWFGMPLDLTTHHCNENHTDCRLENIRILCGNCHYGIAHSKSLYEDVAKLYMSGEYEKANHIVDILVLDSDRITQTIENILNKEERKYNYQNKLIEERFCEVCGKPLTKQQPRFCSRECFLAKEHPLPSKYELLSVFRELKTFVAVGKHYGRSDTNIRSWCKKLGILEIVIKEIQCR